MAKFSIEKARFNMIEQQIRPAEVLDPTILSVINDTHRDDFVPVAYRNLAYSDTRIPLPHGLHMMTPIMEARMLQALAIKPSDKILEIGSGSAYVTALLAKLGKFVYSLEIHADLALQAKKRLQALALSNVNIINADGSQGWLENAPYDVIAVTGSLPQYSEVFAKQLALGGRAFVVYGSAPTMEASLLTKITATEFDRSVLFETELHPLEHVDLPNKFVF